MAIGLRFQELSGQGNPESDFDKMKQDLELLQQWSNFDKHTKEAAQQIGV